MRLKEIRDKLDRLLREYGDTDVRITAPDGREVLVPGDIRAILFGPVFHAVYIGTERRKGGRQGTRHRNPVETELHCGSL